MKQILITNDDGIRASGLLRLAEAARAFGNVAVIAPESERSGFAHSITIAEPLIMTPCAFSVPGVRAWICSGTPADCVRAGLGGLLEERVDLVLSGINYGNNVASDIQYSGTVAAALEAAHEGIPAIAVSEAADPDCSVTDRYLAKVLADLAEQTPGRNAIFNVNFPAGRCRGILTGRTVSAGSMYQARYGKELLPDGALRLTAGGFCGGEGEEGSDFRAIRDGYISVGTVRNVG